jgi:hypothetical protein
MNEVDVFRALIPMAAPDSKGVAGPVSPSPQNFIDRLVAAKLEQLNVLPSALCTDDEFVRRVYLDVIGTLPTPDEVRTYLADRHADRGTRLVENLLGRPEYAEYWALKWSDLLRVDRRVLGYRQAYDYYAWIRDSVAENKPYDRFAREIITAEGLLTQVPEGALFKVDSDPGKIASSVSQVFLGVRIACAQCHHHPYDRWTQTDYYGMQACFSQVAFKPTPRGDLLLALDRSDAQPTHGRGSLCPSAGDADSQDVAAWGPPPASGRLAHPPGQSLVRAVFRQSDVGAFARTGDCRAD